MADQDKTELIIIRRRSTLDTAEVKNSVWKIAYADFMTAMMAFFLVMWLINVTSQETRESVATYFNPIKLTDSTPDRKGINDARRVDPGKAVEEDSLKPQPEPGKATQAASKIPQSSQPRFGEAALFRDPYAVLSEIAGAPPRTAQGGASIDSTRKEGLKGGEAYRDPFDPISWPMASVAPVEDKTPARTETGSHPFDSEADAMTEGYGARPSKGKPDATAAPTPEVDTSKVTQAVAAKQEPPKPAGLFADDESKVDQAVNRTSTQQTEKTSTPKDVAKLQAAISAALVSLGNARPVVEVRETNEGILVNLTDDVNYGMFTIGSAEPTAGLVRALDKITPLISQNRGQVIVRGHTDNRAYRSSEYDNWRLSTARAHMAYHMLVRGGLEAGRIERIEGYADRRPRNQSDPSAAENRRIELLLRAPLP
jgi:chemotaxis protein MotB